MNAKLIDQFIDFYWLTTGASKNTLSAYRSDLKIFSQWLNETSLIEVNKKLIQDYFLYRQSTKISSSTQSRVLTCLHSFYQFLLNNNLINSPLNISD